MFGSAAEGIELKKGDLCPSHHNALTFLLKMATVAEGKSCQPNRKSFQKVLLP